MKLNISKKVIRVWHSKEILKVESKDKLLQSCVTSDQKGYHLTLNENQRCVVDTVCSI